MFVKRQAGKAGVVLVVVVAVAAVGGGLFMLYNDTNQDGPASGDPKKTEPAERIVINDVTMNPEIFNMDDNGEEDEPPTHIRTVDAMGNTTWVYTKMVDIHLPGKGKTVKARKIATATGRKMKPLELKPESAAMADHPSLKRKKGKRKGGGLRKPGTGEDGSEKSNNQGDGGKMGQGKGPGGAGG